MFGDLFDTASDIFNDVTDIVSAPIKVTAHVTRAGTKPIADVANEVVDTVSKIIDD